MPLSDHEQRILAELEESLVRQDPEFAERVRSETVYRHAGRYCKWAAVTFVLGVVDPRCLLFQVGPGRVRRRGHHVRLRRLVRAQPAPHGQGRWHDIRRAKDGDAERDGAAPTGIEGAVSDARDWFRSRFHRREE